MPSPTDVARLLRGNAFGRPYIPDVSFAGKTIIITGSNTGLGFDAAIHVARRGASRLILACRSVEKGTSAREKILKSTGCEGKTAIEVWHVDLASYDSVLAIAQRINNDLVRLDGFIANAGVEFDKFSEAEGLETTLTVNVISTFLIALAVFPKLQSTAAQQQQDTTLSFTGSCIHAVAPDKQISSIPEDQDPFAALSDPKNADMHGRYPLSKCMEHLLFNALSSRTSMLQQHNQHRVNLNIIDPGWCESGLSRNRSTSTGERIASIFMKRSQEAGSRTLVHGVSSRREMNGKYLSNCVVQVQSSYVTSAQGLKDSERLWKAFMNRLESISPDLATTSAWAKAD